MLFHTKEFWKAAGERAAKTFVQFVATLVLLTFGAEVAGVVDVLALDWADIGRTALNIVGTAALGAGLSVVTSLLSAVQDGNPSAGTLEVAAAKSSPPESAGLAE